MSAHTNQCILVIGTPRSGTSCVAGIVRHLGIHIGDRLKSGDEWNRRGYYQDEDLEDILHQYLGLWQFPKWTTSLTPNQEIKDWASNRAGQKLWGVKSNRIVYYLRSFLEGARNVKIIQTSRHIDHSTASWKERSGLEPTPVLNIAEAIPAAFVECGVKPDLIIDYDWLLDNNILGVTKIARFCGVKVNPMAFNIVDKAQRRFGNG